MYYACGGAGVVEGVPSHRMAYRHQQRVRPVPNESLCGTTSMDVHIMHSNPAMTPVEGVLGHLYIHACQCVYSPEVKRPYLRLQKANAGQPGCKRSLLGSRIRIWSQVSETFKTTHTPGQVRTHSSACSGGGGVTWFEGHILGSRHRLRVRPVPNESYR